MLQNQRFRAPHTAGRLRGSPHGGPRCLPPPGCTGGAATPPPAPGSSRRSRHRTSTQPEPLGAGGENGRSGGRHVDSGEQGDRGLSRTTREWPRGQCDARVPAGRSCSCCGCRNRGLPEVDAAWQPSEAPGERCPGDRPRGPAWSTWRTPSGLVPCPHVLRPLTRRLGVGRCGHSDFGVPQGSAGIKDLARSHF